MMRSAHQFFKPCDEPPVISVLPMSFLYKGGDLWSYVALVVRYLLCLKWLHRFT
jgi:hypothetical protein